MPADPTPNLNETELVTQLGLAIAAAYLPASPASLAFANAIAQSIALWNTEHGHVIDWAGLIAEQDAKTADRLRARDGLPDLPAEETPNP